jgi:hypothetical protein
MGHNQITLYDGNIYSVFADENGTSAKILKIDSSGKASTFYTFTATTLAKSIVFLDNFIYFADNDGSGTNYIFRKNVIDNTTDTAFVQISTSNNVYFISDGCGYIYYGANNAIYRVHKSLNSAPLLIAGMSNTTGFQDGSGATAKFNNPAGMAIFNRVLYIADSSNNRIRAIDLSKNIVSTFAGGFISLLDIAIDSVEGAMYVADNQIKKIHNGIVTLFAEKEISSPKGLYLIQNIDGPPTIYVSEDKHIRLIKYV